MNYLDRQAQSVTKNFEAWKKRYPDMEQSTKTKWENKIQKWKCWYDFVNSSELRND